MPKWKIVALAVPEVIFCTSIGAWRGFILGLQNVRDIWEQEQ